MLVTTLATMSSPSVTPTLGPPISSTVSPSSTPLSDHNHFSALSHLNPILDYLSVAPPLPASLATLMAQLCSRHLSVLIALGCLSSSLLPRVPPPCPWLHHRVHPSLPRRTTTPPAGSQALSSPIPAIPPIP